MSCNPFGTQYLYSWGDNRKNIVISDSPSTKYVGENSQRKEFSLFRIDGYVIPSPTQLKCDYLLIRCVDSNCFFIELKGSDLAHASNQILESIRHLRGLLSGHIFNARIVLTKIPAPALRNSNYLKLKQLVESMGGTLIQKSTQLKEVH
jgi:hypothetical protein